MSALPTPNRNNTTPLSQKNLRTPFPKNFESHKFHTFLAKWSSTNDSWLSGRRRNRWLKNKSLQAHADIDDIISRSLTSQPPWFPTPSQTPRLLHKHISHFITLISHRTRPPPHHPRTPPSGPPQCKFVLADQSGHESIGALCWLVVWREINGEGKLRRSLWINWGGWCRAQTKLAEWV